MLDALFLLTGLAWIAVVVGVFVGLGRLERLPRRWQATSASRSKVTAVIPIRNGAEEIDATINGLLSQRGVSLSIIAVDDRSTDATAEILADRAARDPRVTVVRITELPEGWLGKPHACHHGSQAARDADWLLFVDSDSVLGPDVVVRALSEAHHNGFRHLSLVPECVGATIPGRALIISLSAGLFLRAAALMRDRDPRPFGVGAFSLIDRGLYDSLGGHARLRMRVVEDVDLCRMVLEGGERSTMRMAVEDFRVRWITDFPSAFQILEKNYFALFGFRTLPAMLAATVQLVGPLLALAGFLSGTPSGFLAAVAYAATTLCGIEICDRYHRTPLYAIAVPLLLPMSAVLLLHSIVRTIHAGGVRWRDTFYPLARLRAAAGPLPPITPVTTALERDATPVPQPSSDRIRSATGFPPT
ncbi:MAG: glycosyltransferase family 2 protein [Planctomycetota bacterium]